MVRLVSLALSRPYTFVVLAILIFIFGPWAAMRAPKDIFPDIGIPVISVVWSYNGLSPEDMSGRVVYPYERQLGSSVNDIEHVESQSLPGYGVVKIFFQPNVDIRTATAQVTSISQTVLKQMPPGITPPLIINYNASTVPIIGLALSSPTVPEQKIFDLGQNAIRPVIASIPGAGVHTPYGGKVRQIQIDLNQRAMQSKHISAQDVQNALLAQTQITPVGTQKIGSYDYTIGLNNSPVEFEDLLNIPVKISGDSVILLRDVASIRDGNPPQSNIVRVDGGRAVLMTVLKNGNASTLDIVNSIKAMLPSITENFPPGINLDTVGDQSIFVKAAIAGVAEEGLIAAALTSLMILLFLGSWRSTLIITISIPLSILSSIAILNAIGETLNIMTLGGLALAVGILVDDATVTIENINWHLERGKDIQTAILDGAAQIVTPAFVSLLCICIVFVPMFFLEGIPRYLFVPLAEAVIFAMMASFFLSRTLVPTMAAYLLRHQVHTVDHSTFAVKNSFISLLAGVGRFFQNVHLSFNRKFDRIRDVYYAALFELMQHRIKFLIGTALAVSVSFLLLPFLGRDFFPAVDSGQIKIHVRAPVGTRIEETERIFSQIQVEIKKVIPSDEIKSIVDNIGLTVSTTNTAYNNTGTIGPQDGDILISLKEHHKSTELYVRWLRDQLPRQLPGTSFAFLPADIVSQILNFGAPAPIDIQVLGKDINSNIEFARKIQHELSLIPGLVDLRIQQSQNYPKLMVDVDRIRAKKSGINERDVTNSLAITFAGSGQISPLFWLNKKNGISYPVVAQTPTYSTQTLSDLENIPIVGAESQKSQVLGAIADISRAQSPAVVSHYAIQPVVNIFATIQGRDLGAVSNDVSDVLKSFEAKKPKGTTLMLRGQVNTMNSAFSGLLYGLVVAVVLIYLLIVVNFQSWSDPFIVVIALPAALAGIVWMLFASSTTLSVPALTGAIMCMGVATANSILVISFARERLLHTGDPVRAGLEAGFTRFRPVIMTALAMILGMAPMALGLGEGGEQNAPLGRAVIGGLLTATCATLFLVPVLFGMFHKRFTVHHLPGDKQ